MIYDSDYFECGVETGKSNYQNYRWIPELTISMAMTIIDFLRIKEGETILDYGCAKGYLVKAFRLLHREAWGYDISSYAVDHADADIKQYINGVHPFSHFNYGICKDVLEHIPSEELKILLAKLNVRQLFTVVPLGKDGKYYAPSNNKDITHVICEPKEWWLDLYYNCNWICTYSSTRILGIKDSYADTFPNSHLFMVHRRK
jgi:hypothetical protein